MSDHPPSITETAFDCPHCGAYAAQHWYNLGASLLRNDETPEIGSQDMQAELNDVEMEDAKKRKVFKKDIEKFVTGRLAISNREYSDFDDLLNGSVSRCFRCKDVSLWVHQNLYYPRRGTAPTANVDLPPDVRQDYDEASAILELSPKGAAALLRLAVQKLCIFLGKTGRDLNEDIGMMVRDGLDQQIQKALDAVRVIGNESVHPGMIDLNDDRNTAVSLFNLVNLICNRMITQQREVDEVYRSLPQKKLDGIAKRDGSEATPSSRAEPQK